MKKIAKYNNKRAWLHIKIWKNVHEWCVLTKIKKVNEWNLNYLHNVIVGFDWIFYSQNDIIPEQGFKILSHKEENKFFAEVKVFELRRFKMGNSSNVFKKDKWSKCLDNSDGPDDK